jgi:hypothetical protein
MTAERRAMTVAELIEKLKVLPPDLPVYSLADSCGCIGYDVIEVAQEEDMPTGYGPDGNTKLYKRIVALQSGDRE